MSFLIAVAWLALSTVLAPVHVYAQSGTAIVVQDAPFMLLPDATRTPLQTLPLGARLVNVRPDGMWIQGEYNDARFGRRTGYVEARFVRIVQQQSVARPPAEPTSAVATANNPLPSTTTLPKGTSPTGVLTDAEVEQAITLGTTKDPLEYMGTGSPGRYRVTILGRLGRLAFAAFEAKRQYKPLSTAALSEEMKVDEATVQVMPNTPVVNRNRVVVGRSGLIVPDPVVNIVLRADGQIAQPARLIPRPQEWTNGFGARLSSAGAIAVFTALPPGDFDVVIVTTGGEVVHRVRGGDREKLQWRT
jgi:hypothetical protein